MAKPKPVYERLDEYTSLAQQIVNKYPAQFGTVNLDKITCVQITNNERPEKKDKLWEVKNVVPPVSLDCPYTFYVIVYGSDWHSMDKKHKLLLICETLQAMTDTDEGKVNTFDSHGYKIMQRTFGGIDYLVQDDVPDILEDKIIWKDYIG